MSCDEYFGRPATLDEIRALVDGLFEPSSSPAIGVEIEVITYPRGRRADRPALDVLTALTREPLPAHSAITLEPGGQLELSSAPHRTACALLVALADDLRTITDRLDRAGVGTELAGIDLLREPQRIRTDTRYQLMEHHFDRLGPAGRWMMNNTASVQLNLSMPGDPVVAWRLLYALGPVLTAAFANSPGRCATGETWQSLRQGCWLHMDPTRTAVPSASRDPRDAYFDYVLDSEVFLMLGEGGSAALPEVMTLRSLLDKGNPTLQPTLEDVRVHLTTLFPPVRPRGWFELRMIDAGSVEAIEAAIGVGAALLDAAVIGELVDRGIGVPGAEVEAARLGTTSPRLRSAADALLAVAIEGLAHNGEGRAADAVTAHCERMATGRFEESARDEGWRLEPIWMHPAAELTSPDGSATSGAASSRPAVPTR